MRSVNDVWYVNVDQGTETYYDVDTRKWVTLPWHGAAHTSPLSRLAIPPRLIDPANISVSQMLGANRTAARVLLWCIMDLRILHKPALTWFKSSADPNIGGQFYPDENKIALSDTLSRDQVAYTVAHECRHAHQWQRARALYNDRWRSEADAHAYAQRVYRLWGGRM